MAPSVKDKHVAGVLLLHCIRRQCETRVGPPPSMRWHKNNSILKDNTTHNVLGSVPALFHLTSVEVY